MFLLDVTSQAIATGYLDIVCSVLKKNIANLPGDARTKVSIICFDSSIHYLAVLENQDKAQLLSFPDIDGKFTQIIEFIFAEHRLDNENILCYRFGIAKTR